MANGPVGVRYLVLDHKFPLGDHVEAQNRGLYHSVAYGRYTGVMSVSDYPAFPGSWRR